MAQRAAFGTATGVLAFAATVAVIVGAWWWWAAAPPAVAPPALVEQSPTPAVPVGWMAAAERAVPDRPPSPYRRGPFILTGADPAVEEIALPRGGYDLDLACAGAGEMSVTVTARDGRPLGYGRIRCAEETGAAAGDTGTAAGEAGTAVVPVRLVADESVRVGMRSEDAQPGVLFWRFARPLVPDTGWLPAARQAMPERPGVLRAGDAVVSMSETGERSSEIDVLGPIAAGAYRIDLICVGAGVVTVSMHHAASSQAWRVDCDGRRRTDTVLVPDGAGTVALVTERHRGSGALAWRIREVA